MKNNYIAHVKEYFGKRYRSLTKKVKGGGPTRKTGGFAVKGDPYTLVLKERTWRIEINRRNAKKFFQGHRIGTIVVVALIFAGIGVHYALIGFASTADFYPSSCLGNWDNVQSALGKPDVPPGASTFSALNSATFSTSTAQMFCGNFSGDTDIGQLTDKSFESANLVLSWTFIFPEVNSTTATVITSGGGGDVDSSDTISQASASSTQSSTPDVSSSTTDDGSTLASSTPSGNETSSSIISAASSTTGVASSSVEATSTSNDKAASTTASTTTTIIATTTVVTASTTASTTVGTNNSTSVSPSSTTVTPVVTPAPTSTPAAAPDPSPVSSGTAPTSWLRDFIGVAYADEMLSLATDTSTTVDASATDVDSSTSMMDTSNTENSETQPETETSSLPQPTPITVNTSMLQNIVVPSSTGGAVLAIVYSTDGVTWQPLVNIDSSNWQEARYPIPIHSWTELQHLQIAFVGLGATSSPQIFLDAVGVEVSYTDPPPSSPAEATSSDVVSAAPVAPSAGTPGAIIPPTPAELPPAQALKQVFDPFAGQSCLVTPFSESVVAGATGSFLLKLTPPAIATSSVSKKAPKAQSFLYDASIGALPDGISATIIPGNSGMDTIGVTTAANVAPGSYNVVVIYQELQHDGTTAPNFCQFNIVVPGPSS